MFPPISKPSAELSTRPLAKRLDEGAEIGVAAAEIGYDLPEAFNQVFKRLVGVTPGAWRKLKGSG